MRYLLFVMTCTIPCLAALADDPQPALKEFVSKEGGFSVLMPGTPQESREDEGGGVVQFQFIVARGDGMYLVSYQDNPELKGGSDDDLAKRLKQAQEKVRAGFQGNLLASKLMKLADKYPGLDYECDMPSAGGLYHSRSYLVDGRLYQLLAVGTKEYTSSAETQQFLGSLKLVKP